MAFFTTMAGVCLFGLTACKTTPQIEAVTCINAFFQNAYYGVLFGYAPELFPTPVRGTGDALCASFNRICGFMAPVIAIFSNAMQNPDGPVYASGAIYLATGLLMCFLPVETYGKTAL
jgi:sugar phosphate permease